MKAHMYRMQQSEETAEGQIQTEEEARSAVSGNLSLTKAVHDWNHALEIATDRMWGSETPLLQIVRRK
jgi:hypothetical protein